MTPIPVAAATGPAAGAGQIDPQVIAGASRRGRIERVLWLHRTDRWYFGDFLRHAAWLQWLRDAFPDASIDLASHPAYLPLYADNRFSRLLDVTALPPRSTHCYDLVVQPTAYPPGAFDDDVPLLLATWDTGWALRAAGRTLLRGVKDDLNYFRAAHPSAVLGPRTTRTTPVAVEEPEAELVGGALSRVFPDLGPVVVYNPTASNPFTRCTHLPKEVDNALTAAEHAAVLRRIVGLLPGHGFLVGASLKPGDTANARMVSEVADLAPSRRVVPVTRLPAAGVTSLRGFATLLASPRVCAVTGSGTGTNTHLAALTGTCGFSIERGADAAMAANWARGGDFQMGSFRWRNPNVSTGIHVLDWSARTETALAAAARAFVCHHALAHDPCARALFAGTAPAWLFAARSEQPWVGDPAGAVQLAQGLLDAMTPAARAHYGDFDDEVAYLTRGGGVGGRGLDALAEALTGPCPGKAAIARQLFEDSNLHKLLGLLTPAAVPVPSIA